MLLRQRLNGVLESRWADGHVVVSTLWEDFARYVYLPRLRDQAVMLKTVEGGPVGFAWTTDGFGVAAGMDEATGRYLGLASEGVRPSAVTPTSLVVHPDRALTQLEAEKQAHEDSEPDDGEPVEPEPDDDDDPSQPAAPRITTFRGSIKLDSARPTRAFTKMSEEVLTHLLSHPDIEAEVHLEVRIQRPEGFSEHTIRTVTENTRALHFEEGTGFSET